MGRATRRGRWCTLVVDTPDLTHSCVQRGDLYIEVSCKSTARGKGYLTLKIVVCEYPSMIHSFPLTESMFYITNYYQITKKSSLSSYHFPVLCCVIFCTHLGMCLSQLFCSERITSSLVWLPPCLVSVSFLDDIF